jgi:sugar phosphate isomerase/epimerase
MVAVAEPGRVIYGSAGRMPEDLTMQATRREWLAGAAGTALGGALTGRLRAAATEAKAAGLKVAMCDWSMGRLDPSAFEVGKQIGLDGVEVSIGFPDDNLKLRRPDVQAEYLAAARKHGMLIPSMAMGVLNRVPLMSEPRTALWVADTIEVAPKLGVRCILLAFFGHGELREENADDIRRVTEALIELAPRAEKAGVILGLETYLTAEAHLKILDKVESRAVRVYYDVYNANHKGHDVLKEIRLIGAERICQVHFMEGPDYLGGGKIDWPAVVGTLREIGYPGWAVLETTSPSKDVVADTRRNLAYLRGLFEKRT